MERKMRRSRTPTVLVVDDDDDWRDVVCRTLSPTYRTPVATNGADALQMARRSPPALILLDVMMPGDMDGFRTLCELRKDPVTRKIPVILVTAVNTASGLDFSPRELKAYLGTAPEAMIEKPVTVKMLLAVVERVLRDSREKGA